MKKQPFYKKGIGHPFKQTDDNNVIYTDQPNINGQPLHMHEPGHYESMDHQDPNRGQKVDGSYQTFTDPDTGKKANINQNRSYAKAQEIDTKAGNVPANLKPEQYKDFAIASKKHFQDTGKWLKFGDFSSANTANENANVVSSGGGNNENNTINNNETNTNNGVGRSILSRGFDTLTKDFELPKYTPQDIDLSGGRKAGLVRQFDASKGGFQGQVLDQKLMESGTDRSSIRHLKKGIKGMSKTYGATGREARAQAQLAKAVRLNAAAGLTTRETDASGKTINESATKGLGLDPTAAAGGKARKRAAKAMRRYNRMQHRMKSHEGHNIDPKGIGSQYYGKGDVYNKPKGWGDGRNAQLRAAGGPGSVTVGNTNTQDLLNNEVNPSSIVPKKRNKKKTSNASVNKSIENIGVINR